MRKFFIETSNQVQEAAFHLAVFSVSVSFAASILFSDLVSKIKKGS